MHSNAEVNEKLSRLMSSDPTQVAREGLEHLAAFTPIRFEAPPSWLSSAIDQARRNGREGNPEAARQVVANIATEKDSSVGLGKYREHVAWVERENARKLAALAWMWSTLRRVLQYDVETDHKLERLERFVSEHYGVRELRTERGWAERQTRADALLPQAWRGC